ncbi:MAG TPA: hypothetical protein VHV77_08140, partial [Pirellulales bacterium]|nr:hypothetical protein [Pirellulales bacterium]
MSLTRRHWPLGFASLFIASTMFSSQVRVLDAQTVEADTFTRPDGSVCYAATLTPPTAKPDIMSHDILVLFDTSASQAGEYREKAFETLEVFLGALRPEDRVQLSA